MTQLRDIIVCSGLPVALDLPEILNERSSTRHVQEQAHQTSYIININYKHIGTKIPGNSCALLRKPPDLTACPLKAVCNILDVSSSVLSAWEPRGSRDPRLPR